MKQVVHIVKIVALYCLLFYSPNLLFANHNHLENKIKNCNSEKETLDCISSLDSLLYSNPKLALLYAVQLSNKTKQLTSELTNAKIKLAIAKANNFNNNNNNNEAIKIVKEIYTVFLQNKDIRYQAESILFLASIEDEKNEYETSLKKAQVANKLFTQINFKSGIARSIYRIGSVYSNLRQHQKALETLNNALELIDNDLYYKAKIYFSIASVYNELELYDKAILYYNNALELKLKYGVNSSVAATLSSIGNAYSSKKNYETALKYHNQAYELYKMSADKRGMASSLNNISGIYYYTNDYVSCEKYLLRVLALSKEVEDVDFAQIVYENLAEISRVMGRYEDALSYMEESLNYQDTILSKKFETNIAEMQAKFEVEKAKEKAEKERIRREADNKTSKYVIFSIALLGLLVSVIAVFIYKQSTLRKYANAKLEVQKKQIEIKNHEIELKNKDITDSIKYAKHIQEAIVPPNEFIKKFLPQSFVLYLPKDIVAGDFYWVDNQTNDLGELLVYFAVVDCTGHGVPGAMMSVVGANGLYRCVDEFALREPAAILDKLTAIVEDGFKRGGNVINDGMDISLGRLNLGHGKSQSFELTWAGANNPIWIFKKNGEFIEYTANKQPIGKFDYRKPFTQHLVRVEKGDTLYLFTDGYADQFGGPKGKKLKYSNLKKLLADVKDLDAETQKNKIDVFFNEWRGDLEQIDDVCIMGIKI